MHLTFVCRFCFATTEDLDHLFLCYCYDYSLWKTIGVIFGFAVPRANGSTFSMLESCCGVPSSSHIQTFSMTTIISRFSAYDLEVDKGSGKF